jgi:hypothetical protein
MIKGNFFVTEFIRYVERKAISIQLRQAPGVSRFLDNRHMKMARLLAFSTGHHYPQEIFLMLISVRG